MTEHGVDMVLFYLRIKNGRQHCKEFYVKRNGSGCVSMSSRGGNSVYRVHGFDSGSLHIGTLMTVFPMT